MKYWYFCCASPRPWRVYGFRFAPHVLQHVKRNIAILSLPALTPNGVDSDLLQQIKRNIAIFAVPALALGVFTCVALRVFFATIQAK